MPLRKDMFMNRIMIALLLVMAISLPVSAQEGEMGPMGGVSSGSNLPKTIEKYVEIPETTTNTYVYKEVVFVTGEPVVFEGTIKVAKDTSVTETNDSGSYTEKFTIAATNGDENSLERTLSYTVDFRVKDGDFKKQITTTIRESTLKWSETITIDDESYELDEDASSFTMGGITDMTPGVAYFSTSVSYVAAYNYGEGGAVLVDVDGTNYGYSQPWSKIETQIRDISIEDATEDIQLAATTESVLEAKKTLYYDETEPYPISFDGTYNQRMEREGTLSYRILTYDPDLDADLYEGSTVVHTANQIEKLPIPEGLDFIEGHWAEEDFKKLYSMEILTDLPHQGIQYEAISRGDFIKALCLAMNIDITPFEGGDKVIFGDVQPDNPLYPYVMAAYDKKLIKGTGENFDLDRPINREEAFVVYIRVIGLERLGVTESPMTPFVDDREISSWAKKEIMAGYKLGIIQGDNTGSVNPQQWISKAEAAAIINRLVDYLRDDIGDDYRQ